jgi:predicted metal-dependent hydrolase
MIMPHNKTGFNRGLGLFNRGHFFDAHEVLEDVWREAPLHSVSRRRLQGVVQLAVAFHHQSKGNHVGARSVLERAMRNISDADSSFPDLDLDRLRADLDCWREHLDNCVGAREKCLEGRDVRRHSVCNSKAPALPKIRKRR